MSSGSFEILQIAKETVFGTTPVPFARTALPFTDTTLDATTTKEDSATKLSSRLAQQGAITAIDYGGDINSEFRFGSFDDLIAGCAQNAWVTDSPAPDSDTLTFGGDVKQSFSILRGFTDVGANGNYHLFRGMYVNTFNLTIPESGIVTTTFGMLGLGRTPSNTAPTGAVTEPTLTDPFTSVAVTDIQIDGVTTVGVACVTALDFTWDNTAQVQRCLGGGLGIGNIIPTVANGSGSITVAWSVRGAELYEKQFTNTLSSITVSLKDGQENEYVLTLPKVETNGQLPSGGNSDILQATYDFRVVNEAPTLTRTPKV